MISQGFASMARGQRPTCRHSFGMFRLLLLTNALIKRLRALDRSPYLDQYVRTPNRLAFGERTVIVMSSKVAQKSYGTEKRCVIVF